MQNKQKEGSGTMLHRHDIGDKIWNKINKNLPGSKGSKGRNGVGNRKFINAVLWILCLGEICHQNIEIGRTLTDVFQDGEAREFGTRYLKH